MSLITDLAGAIQRMEGWSAGSVSFRNNNPGNLRPLGGGRTWTGQTGVDAGGYAVFGSLAAGQAALQKQVQTLVNRGLTLTEFFAGQRDAAGRVVAGGYAGYAPAADHNQPNIYAGNVAGWLGLPADVPLSQIAARSFDGGGVDPGAPASSFSIVGDSVDSLLALPDSAASSTVVYAAAGVGLVSLLWWLFR